MTATIKLMYVYMFSEGQKGGGMNKTQLWQTYGPNIIHRLMSDRTFGKDATALHALPDGFLSADKTYHTYLEWIVRSYLDGGIRLYEDIRSRVYPALHDYVFLLRKRVLSKGDPTKPGLAKLIS